MMQSDNQKSYPFERSGNYRIRVLGFLDEIWSERLGGLHITAISPEDQEGPVIELVGKVRDQAELSGLLNSLYDLQLTLLSVEHLKSN